MVYLGVLHVSLIASNFSTLKQTNSLKDKKNNLFFYVGLNSISQVFKKFKLRGCFYCMSQQYFSMKIFKNLTNFLISISNHMLMVN